MYKDNFLTCVSVLISSSSGCEQIFFLMLHYEFNGGLITLDLSMRKTRFQISTRRPSIHADICRAVLSSCTTVSL